MGGTSDSSGSSRSPGDSGTPGESVVLSVPSSGDSSPAPSSGRTVSGAPPDESRSGYRRDERWKSLKGASVLVIDDDLQLGRALQRLFSLVGANVKTAPNGAVGMQMLGGMSVDVVLLDVALPDTNGLDLLDQVKVAKPDCEVVMITGHADTKNVVTAIRKGAFDFLPKPFDSKEVLLATATKAVDHRRRLRNQGLLATPTLHEAFDTLVGISDTMKRTREAAATVAATPVAVLILGETGTGKELMARAIHQAGPRCDRPFVAINCSAIAAELVESELFGHERGAFTGAVNRRIGVFQKANEGTLFLDEIGDLPAPAQAKLLRALQDGEVRSVGSDEPRYVDTRVVAATNIDLKAKVDRGEFRADLFYRLNVVSIRMPPLRKRREDIPVLAAHFVLKHAERLGCPPKEINRAATFQLLQYDWPGNVRELENTIERALIVCRSDTIGPEHVTFHKDAQLTVPPVSGEQENVAAMESAMQELSSLPYSEAKKQIVRDFEVQYLKAVLARVNGNISEAARQSGLDRSNFRRILKKVLNP